MHPTLSIKAGLLTSAADILSKAAARVPTHDGARRSSRQKVRAQRHAQRAIAVKQVLALMPLLSSEKLAADFRLPPASRGIQVWLVRACILYHPSILRASNKTCTHEITRTGTKIIRVVSCDFVVYLFAWQVLLSALNINLPT